jgi:hypothetical protein
LDTANNEKDASHRGACSQNGERAGPKLGPSEIAGEIDAVHFRRRAKCEPFCCYAFPIPS